MYPSLSARALGLPLAPEETIELASTHGFGGVDLLARDIVEEGRDLASLRRILDDSGIRGGAWPLPVSWRGEEAIFRADLDRLPRYADAAAALGLTRTGTWLMPEIPRRFAGLPLAEALERTTRIHVERLGAIARVLGARGIRLGLEAIGVASFGAEGGEPFVRGMGALDRVLEPLRQVAPEVGVLVDGFHLFAAGEPMALGSRWGIERVAWVHVADIPPTMPRDPDRALIRDDDRGLPGEHPAVDTAGLLRLLRDQGYEGPVTPEPLPGCASLAGLTAFEAVGRLAGAMRSVWPSGSET